MDSRVLNRIIAITIAVSMIFIPSASFARVPHSPSDYTTTYNAEGGVIYFNENTGAVVGCDDTVTSVSIPAEISGVPVVKIGDYAFESSASLETVEMTDSITEIGYDAFSNAVKLKSIVLSDNLTKIDNSAFSGCTSLEEVILPDGITRLNDRVFWGCTALNKIELPDSLQSIGYSCFYNCNSLTSVLIPKNVTSMSNTSGGVFEHCGSLTDVYFEEGMTRLPNYACAGISSNVTVHIPDSVTEFGSLVFLDAKFTSFEIPENVTVLGYGTFYGSLLESIVIPDTVTEMSSNIFYECSNLKSAFIKCDMTLIPSGTFYGCTSLNEVEFPANITKIEYDAFSGCELIDDFNWPTGLTEIGDNAFKGTGLKEIDFPDGLKKIGYDAFDGCGALTKVVIPETVTSAESAFSKCTQLTEFTFEGDRTNLPNGFFSGAEIDFRLELPASLNNLSPGLFSYAEFKDDYELIIPDSVEKIGDSCFIGSNLASFTVPSEVKIIDNWAFRNCEQLNSIVFNNKLEEIGSNAFYKCSKLENVDFPDSLIKLGRESFSGTALTSVHITANVADATGAFSGCESLDCNNVTFAPEMTVMPKGMFSSLKGFSETYIVPENIKVIGEDAFSYSNVQTIVFHEGVTEIKENAFYSCSKLSEVVSKGGLKVIGPSAFEYCNALIELSLYMDNGTIKNDAFHLCQKMELAEIYGVDIIDNEAFSNCYALNEVIIGDGTTSIGYNSFKECRQLEHIRIPESITNIAGALNDYNEDFCPVIYAPEGSYAEQYAEEYGYDFADNNISAATVKLPERTYYMGVPAEPKPVVTIDDMELTEGVDYTVGYTKNDAVGTGQVIIKGCGFFAGEKTVNFKLLNPVPEITGPTTYTKTYGDRAFKLNAELSVSGNVTYSSSNNKVVKVDNNGTVTITGPGTASVTVKYAGNDKWGSTQKRITVKVLPKTLTNVNSTVKTKSSVTFKWNKHVKHTNLVGYQIQYSTSASFKTANTTTKYIKNLDTNNLIIKVKQNKEYYIRVRAYTKTGGVFLGGKWSAVDTVRINNEGLLSVITCETQSITF